MDGSFRFGVARHLERGGEPEQWANEQYSSRILVGGGINIKYFNF